MDVLKAFFLLLTIFTDSSIQQVLPRQEIVLLNISQNLINCELNLVKNYTTLSTIVGYASSNLKAVNIAPDLSKILDETLIKIDELKTLKNHREFFNLTGYSVCDYLNIRMSFLDLEMRHLHSVINEVEGNFSILYGKLSEISKGYEINLKTLAMNWSRERMIVLVFKQMLLMFKEIFNYIKILKISLKYYEHFHTYISRFQCKIPTNSSFADAGNKIEANLKECEMVLKNSERFAIEKLTSAMTQISSSLIIKATSASNSKVGMDKIKFDLEKFSTVSDFPKTLISWPRIPDLTGDMSVLPRNGRIKACEEKKERYEKIYEDHHENRTKLENAHKDFLNIKTSRKVRGGLNPQIDEALNATSAVFIQFTECMRGLNNSIAEVHAGNGAYGFYYSTGIAEIIETNGFEVVVCVLAF